MGRNVLRGVGAFKSVPYTAAMAIFGELETAVLNVLWAQEKPMRVRDVHEVLTRDRELAYTTVMTVLDRLAKKGLVDRDLVNRAWQYRAHNTQAEVLAAELGDLLARVPDGVRLDALARLAAMLGPHERAAVANR